MNKTNNFASQYEINMIYTTPTEAPGRGLYFSNFSITNSLVDKMDGKLKFASNQQRKCGIPILWVRPLLTNLQDISSSISSLQSRSNDTSKITKLTMNDNVTISSAGQLQYPFHCYQINLSESLLNSVSQMKTAKSPTLPKGVPNSKIRLRSKTINIPLESANSRKNIFHCPILTCLPGLQNYSRQFQKMNHSFSERDEIKDLIHNHGNQDEASTMWDGHEDLLLGKVDIITEHPVRQWEKMNVVITCESSAF